MKVEITIVVENSTPIPGLCGEYGLAMLVKIDEQSILFDTGLEDGAVKNLKNMWIDPKTIGSIVLSHGHFDHAGGIIKVLDYLGPRDIYIHPEAVWPKFIGTPNQNRSIGMPLQSEIESRGGHLIMKDGPQQIMPGVYLTGSIPRTNDFEDTGGKFSMERDGQWCDDPLIDDQALIIDHPEGLIIISGCAHAGMVNTIECAKEITGKDKIKAFIGGTHLIAASADRVSKTIKSLIENNIEQIVVSHCTGFNATVAMFNELGPKVVKGETGARFVF